jgi:ATP-binding cassette, subfamily B, bacterial HlyB/CyaB
MHEVALGTLAQELHLDQQTAEHFAQTINRIKGKVTMIFITHQVPKGLQVDEVVNMGQHAMHISLVKET